MKQATINRKKNIIEIKWFDQNKARWMDTLHFIKENIIGREFIKDVKIWEAPLLDDNIEALRNYGFQIFGEEIIPEDVNEDINWKDIDIPVEQFPDLRPYQLDFLRFMVWRNGRGLCADDMGTGKTVQALSYLKLFPDKRPALIVCPASVKLQWEREYRRWAAVDGKVGDITILSGRTPWGLAHTNGTVIINWDILSTKQNICSECKNKVSKQKVKQEIKFYCSVCEKLLKKENIVSKEIGWINALEKIPFKALIGDEIQAIGDPKANRTKAFKKLAKKIPDLIGLSGTPIRSRPAQFFTMLNLIAPDIFSNRMQFQQSFCDPKFNGFGWVYNGATHVEELHKLVKPLMIRRRKSGVLKDLPSKIRTVVPLEIGDLSEYNRQYESFKSIEGKTYLEIKRELEGLQNTAFNLKKGMVVKWVKDFLDSGEKLVVGAYHRAVMRFLIEEFKDISVNVYGETSMKDRDVAIQRFQEDEKIKLFIGNILSAGVGIDGLQKVCSHSAIVELIWTPTDHLQFEDRLHRIGQDLPVNVNYLIAPGTIEDEIMLILDSKMKMIDAVIDGKKTDDIDLLSELIKKYKGEINERV